MANKAVVVCHYDKNISWVNSIDNADVYVYYKSVKPELHDRVILIESENVGREPETFINHIVNNYNNLHDELYFLQDNPFEHGFNLGLINQSVDGFSWLGENLLKCYLNGKPHAPWGLPCKEIIELLGLRSEELITFLPGSQFCVNRETILKRNLKFYELCHSLLLKGYAQQYSDWYTVHKNLGIIDSASPWVFERIWGLIFDV